MTTLLWEQWLHFQPHRAEYKSTSELGRPVCTGQTAGPAGVSEVLHCSSVVSWLASHTAQNEYARIKGLYPIANNIIFAPWVGSLGSSIYEGSQSSAFYDTSTGEDKLTWLFPTEAKKFPSTNGLNLTPNKGDLWSSYKRHPFPQYKMVSFILILNSQWPCWPRQIWQPF